MRDQTPFWLHPPRIPPVGLPQSNLIASIQLAIIPFRASFDAAVGWYGSPYFYCKN